MLGRSIKGILKSTRMAEHPRLAFLHIPKTGGTYTVQHEGSSEPVVGSMKWLGHSYVITSPDGRNVIYEAHDPHHMRIKTIMFESLADLAVFANVRNIYSWLVSYLYHAGYKGSNYVNKDHYDYAHAQKGFEYLLKTIVNREAPWPSRKFIHAQLFAENGDFVPDWINHQKTLDSDLEAMARHYRVRYETREKQRLGGSKKDYREFYTDELAALVDKTWKRELTLFGYTFDGYHEASKLYHQIEAADKRRLKYFWRADKLFVNGREVIPENGTSDFLLPGAQVNPA